MSSGFVTETELAEARKKRQEEWDKIRKPTDPEERPEEPYDSRSLFERLQEQKQKKELEYEEAHKLKNMIKGLDDDEIEFLDLVDRTKLAADRTKELEEAKELSDFRNRVTILQEKNLQEKLQEESILAKSKSSPKTKVCISHQQKLLKGAVVTKKRKMSDVDSCNEKSEEKPENESKPFCELQISMPQSSLKCVGILPGLGCYTESSDENSSDSEIEISPKKRDIIGRRVKEIEKVDKAS
ncbi:hypothetical protein HHI36_001676 [Cryptolaemus montrouzieri]|uniref:FAM192A/Fyv6 N-terminal domain-containing protein n=1 Tax=Cryptolaemus montrouzieri TaxID=559131 RepID=A0ABD2P8N3_9CUCU